MKALKLLVAGLVFLAPATAQTLEVRGEVEDRNGNNFFLDGTRVRLTSANVNLRALENGGTFRLQVRNTGTVANPSLEVTGSNPDRERFAFDTGLRIGQRTFCEIKGAPGATGFVYLDAFASTGVTPVPNIGVWLLSGNAILAGSRVLRPNGEAELGFNLPRIPSLVGARITGQAAVLNANSLILTNPDDATIRG